MQVFWLERWNFWSGRCRRPDGSDRSPRGAHDDAGRVDLVDDAGPARADRGAGIARHDRLHAGADERARRLDERHRLALHVRAHEGAVRVVVLEERDQRRRNRHELLRRHVHEVDAVRRDDDDVAGAPADHQVLGELPSASMAAFAWATLYFASSIAER
jgi:hypothetical protein